MRLYKKNWEIEEQQVNSLQLNRTVRVDFYFPKKIPFGSKVEMLLFNDGQILAEMNFLSIIADFYRKKRKALLLVIGVHANENRIQEYGTSFVPNIKKEGSLALNYATFLLNELIPFAFKRYPFLNNIPANIAGFSLGGLSAFDIAWENGRFFHKIGVFSGSFWWRSKDLKDQNYNDDMDRIMLNKINQYNGQLYPHKFFFECGTLDEMSDRNNNGIIDSIDDTKDIINALQKKGYSDDAINYYEVKEGKHEVSTWKFCMPIFLEWGWG